MTEQTSSTVPQIRFSGFEGDWDDQTLGKLFPITSAARVHKHAWTKSGVPFFRSSDVVSAFMGKVNTKAFISHELYLDLSEKVGRVKKGDMLVTGGGSIGIPYLVETDDPLYFKDADLLWFKIRDSVDSHYLFTFFSSQLFGRYVKSISHIGTIAHYTVEQAKITPLAVPRIKTEQTQIGKYFRELDRLIGLHQRKHDKLVTLKKAMLQKMFPQPGATTPEIRFKGFEVDWEKKTLGQIANVYQPQTISQRDLTETGFDVYGANGIIGKYSKYNHKEPQIAVTCRGNTCGTVNFTKEKSWITGNAMVVNIDENALINKQFLFQQLSSQDLNYLITGSGQPQITGAIKLHEMWICHPTEQQKIGTYFRTLDALIAQHATQLQKLQQIKSACLERMFV